VRCRRTHGLTYWLELLSSGWSRVDR
jgi:hypothetical protein